MPKTSKFRPYHLNIEHTLSSWMHYVRYCHINVNSKMVCKKVKRIAKKKM